jgi:murein DD-endopeptidase MepM/ murein hydrolase activator NlpD
MNKQNTKRPKKPHLSLPCVGRKASQGLMLFPQLSSAITMVLTIVFLSISLVAMGLLLAIKKIYLLVSLYPYSRLTIKYSLFTLVLFAIFGLITIGQSEIKKQENIKTIIASQEEHNEYGQISNDIGWESWGENFIVPVNGYKSQGYHKGHPGIDYAAEIYSPIHPITTGKVVHTGWEAGGYGITVVVDHDHGLFARYAHMAKTEVKVGDTVKTDTVIGEVGLTGHTTGPHVHVEIYDQNKNIDPEDFIPLTH